MGIFLKTVIKVKFSDLKSIQTFLFILFLILTTNGCNKEKSSNLSQKKVSDLYLEKNKINEKLFLDIPKIEKKEKLNRKRDQGEVKNIIPNGSIWMDTEGFVDCCFYFGAFDLEEKRNGPWRAYYKNGIVHMEMFFTHGIMNGMMKGFHENGIPMLEGKWEDNRRIGIWRFWNPDKTLWKKGKFINDKMNGEWLIHEQGKKLICQYKDEVRLICKNNPK
jgi:antitoxin component YwqK of YwqJK toxin-antitoxin module